MTSLETAIAASDPDALAAFYRAVFEFETEWTTRITDLRFHTAGLGTPCHVICLRNATGQRLKFLGPSSFPQNDAGPQVLLEQAGSTLLTLVVEDLAHTLVNAIAAGAKPLGSGEVIDVSPGVEIVFLRDPEGNALEVLARERSPKDS